ncbi:MAG: DUF58 domain-containing protein [Actinobacteria bacterium]|nr:DUF58 domain-containing protein [Actinomycetota bacterium]
MGTPGADGFRADAVNGTSTRTLDPFAGAGRTDTSRARTEQILRRLELTVNHRLDGLLHGDHLGLVPGHGTEPGETRAYTAGDDVRRIDWNVTARMQRPYLRTTIADRELETWVVVDRSASIDFGTAACTKADLVLAATAAIGFLTAHTGNRIGAVLLHPGSSRTIPARSGRDHLLQILHRIATDPPGEARPIDLGAGIARLTPTLRRRGLVAVVSDFLADPNWERQMRALSTRHEVLAVEVVDPRELELPDVGAISLCDPESGRTMRVDTSSASVRARFAAAATGQRDAIATSLRRAGVDHLQLRTDRDWVADLVRHVALRRRRRIGHASRAGR